MEKRTWIWMEDSQLRKAVITEDSIVIYDQDGNIIIRIKNPSKSLKKQLITEIQKKEQVTNSRSDMYGGSQESVR